ncbi:uncharacterized protein LOC142176025 [Nicotiana tabacum]|uniref:Uncharacterized protein LOC142176025 n=1 Tax=Nicotiana tabacum TaxID=4097 RepID=A0AC58TPK5_TOBAC
MAFEKGGDDGTLRYRGRLCVPDVDELRERIVSEAHNYRCKLPISWFEVGEAELLGPDLVNQSMEKVKLIQEHLKTAQSCQKSYSNMQHRYLEFQVDDWVFLNISPEKGVIRFGKKGKLNPRYIGPYRIL